MDNRPFPGDTTAIQQVVMAAAHNAVCPLPLAQEARDTYETMRETLWELYWNTTNRQDEPFIKYIRQAVKAALDIESAARESA